MLIEREFGITLSRRNIRNHAISSTKACLDFLSLGFGRRDHGFAGHRGPRRSSGGVSADLIDDVSKRGGLSAGAGIHDGCAQCRLLAREQTRCLPATLATPPGAL